MAEDNAVLYTAVYTSLEAAEADLDALERLHRDKVIGKYDAALIDQENGQPHIVERVDHPAIRIIPESLGSGPLPRGELHDAARALDADQVALVVIGEPTLEKGFEKAVTRATRIAKRDMNAATDELARELDEVSKA